ncbi:hypothetical protein N9F71_00235 [bacterium]|nr:hypothetical protein [bacterium]
MITQADLDAVEKYADRVFAKVGIDVEFTRHFLDRANDARNKKDITSAELIRLFKKTFKKHGKAIPKLGPDAEAVLKDMQTDINVPFVLNLRRGELELVAKTVMRKKNFKTPDPELAVEMAKRNTPAKAGKDFKKLFETKAPVRGTRPTSVLAKTRETLNKVNELKFTIPNKGDIPRNKMPQIESEDYKAYLQHMKRKGIVGKAVKVDPKKLKAIQSEFSDKGVVISIKKNDDKPILISNDKYVIDGNHRWLAAIATRKDAINAIQFNASKDQVLRATLAFPKVIFKQHG